MNIDWSLIIPLGIFLLLQTGGICLWAGRLNAKIDSLTDAVKNVLPRLTECEERIVRRDAVCEERHRVQGWRNSACSD